jgi:hypothetical protein
MFLDGRPDDVRARSVMEKTAVAILGSGNIGTDLKGGDVEKP